jgi:hypothetical protein
VAIARCRIPIAWVSGTISATGSSVPRKEPDGIMPTNGERHALHGELAPDTSLANHTDHAVERIQRGVRIVVHARSARRVKSNERSRRIEGRVPDRDD